MNGLRYDPILRRWTPWARLDLTLPAYQQQASPTAYIEGLAERVAGLERRGA